MDLPQAFRAGCISLGLLFSAAYANASNVASSINAGGGTVAGATMESVGAIGQGQGVGFQFAPAFCHHAGFIQADGPAAPTGLHASITNFFDFTASWNSVSWVDQYYLDVSLQELFGVLGDETTVVGWNFNGDTPVATSGLAVNAAEAITSTASGSLGYINSTSGNRAISLNGWDAGAGSKYWQVSFNASGMANMRVSSVQRSSNTGPKDFKLQYRIGAAGAWTDVPGGDVTVANNYSTGVLQEIPLPAACNDQAEVSLRWIMTSNVAVNESPVAGGGTSAMDSILVFGDEFTPSYVPGYEDLLVAGTSQLVDGLDQNTTYFFRVRADSACMSGYSAVRSVTTRERPIPRISIDSLVHDETPYLVFGQVVTNYMFVYANMETLFAFDGSEELDRVFEVTDAWLANLSNANDLQIHFGSWDPDFGLSRSASPPAGQEHLFTRMTVENWFADNHSNFDLSRSSPDPVISMDQATNVWRFTSPVDGATINAMMVDSNRISATIVNTVGGTREDQQFGWLRVIDDDPFPPRVGNDRLTVMLGETALPVVELDTLVAGWNFNDDMDREGVSHGEGTLIMSLPGTVNYTAGNSLNAVGDDVAGSAFTPVGTDNNGESFEFELDIVGMRDLVMTYATRGTETGYTNHEWSWSTDGVNYTLLENVPANTTATWSLETVDFSDVTELEGATTVYIRNTLSGATGGQGNNRFDNFRFNATRVVYQITDAQLRTVDASNPLDFSLNVYDPISGIHRGSAVDGRNMHIAITGITTNNYDFVPSLSSAVTKDPGSTSVWRFVNGFTAEEVGDLYDEGFLFVSVTVSDRDHDRPNDNMWLNDRIVGFLQVIDDDTDPPEIANVNFPGAAARPFMILTNGVASPSDEAIRGGQLRREGSGTNTIFKVSDFDLVNSGTIGLQFVFGAVDADSGVARGNIGTTNTVMSFSIGDLYDGDVFLGQYDSGLSSPAAGPGEVATNVWTFPNGFFTFEMIDALIEAGRQPIYVTIPDTDNDRPNDQEVLHSKKVGYLQVIDDDIRGPIIASAGIRGAIDEEGILFSAFEASEGWPPPFEPTAGSHDWTNTVSGRTWIGRGAFRTTFPPILSGVQRFGLLTTTYSDPWLQLPPVNNPGVLSLYAGRFGTEAQDITIRVERFNGSTWVGMGDRVVTNRNPTYELYTWDLNVVGEDVLLRIARDVGSGNQVYLEDVSVVPLSPWISTNELDIFWTEAVDDFNDVDEYRLVTPGFGTTVPTAKTDGDSVAATVTNFLVDITGQQGELTGYLFAIDDDDDRPGDRAMGNVISLVARVDTNPPLPIATWDVAEDQNIDDTSEVRLSWTPPGSSEEEGAGWRQSDQEPLSPWHTYRIYYTDEVRAPHLNDPFIDRELVPALGAYDTDTVVLSNFLFGSEYRFSIAGLDDAGNIGELSVPITNTFARFAITQGVAVASFESRFFWTASEGREYDLIHADAYEYSDQINGYWELVGRGPTNTMADSVLLNGAEMRFYRAAPRERWANGETRVASLEVYVAKPIRLRRGQNWLGFPGVPDTVTVARVFGTGDQNNLPRANQAINATRINWYERGGGQVVTQQVYMADNGNWYFSVPDITNKANDVIVPLEQGVVITIPASANKGVYTNLFVGQVPTEPQEQEIVPNNAFNLVSFRLPRHKHPSQMNLLASGFKTGSIAGPTWHQTVEEEELGNYMWALDRVGQQISRFMYYNHAVGWGVTPGWYYTDGPNWYGSPIPASARPFGPDDGIVIRTSGSTQPWTWTNEIPYNTPTQFLE